MSFINLPFGTPCVAGPSKSHIIPGSDSLPPQSVLINKQASGLLKAANRDCRSRTEDSQRVASSHANPSMSTFEQFNLQLPRQTKPHLIRYISSLGGERSSNSVLCLRSANARLFFLMDREGVSLWVARSGRHGIGGSCDERVN